MKFLKGSIPWNKGKKGLQQAWNKGIKEKIIFIPTLCLCNCNEVVWNKNNVYIHGHSSRGKKCPESVKLAVAKANRERIWKDDVKQRASIRMKGNKLRSGQKASKETKDKITGKNSSNYGKPAPRGAGTCKKYLYKSQFQGVVSLFGSYELAYAKYLDSINEPWYYEFKTFELNINERYTTYTPDFYLPSEDKYVEIKGYWYDDAKSKFDKFKETYINIKIELFMKNDLINLGIIK